MFSGVKLSIRSFNLFMLLSYCTIPYCFGYSCYHSNHVKNWHILSQGTYVPNMDLRYSHKAELLPSLLIAMVTVLNGNKGYL